jgi:hypothetical protein
MPLGFLALGLYKLITLKFDGIPNIYFPAPERILGGFGLGALLGVFTGIINVRKSYFEVSSTLGASDLRMILTECG